MAHVTDHIPKAVTALGRLDEQGPFGTRLERHMSWGFSQNHKKSLLQGWRQWTKNNNKKQNQNQGWQA